jgi:hypothetical protein
LQRAGFDLVFAPDAVMHYRLRAGLLANMRQARIYGRGGAQLSAVYSDVFAGDTGADIARTVAWVITRSLNLLLGERRRTSYLRELAGLYGQFQGSREFGVNLRTHREFRLRLDQSLRSRLD